MIWLSIISLAVGALLQRFKIVVLVPATLMVVVVAIGAGVVQTSGARWTVLTIAAASVCIQAGYFVGMLIQHGLRALLAAKSSPFPHTTSVRDSSTCVDFRRGSATQSCAGPQAIDATSRTDPKVLDLLPGHQLSG